MLLNANRQRFCGYVACTCSNTNANHYGVPRGSLIGFIAYTINDYGITKTNMVYAIIKKNRILVYTKIISSSNFELCHIPKLILVYTKVNMDRNETFDPLGAPQ